MSSVLGRGGLQMCCMCGLAQAEECGGLDSELPSSPLSLFSHLPSQPLIYYSPFSLQKSQLSHGYQTALAYHVALRPGFLCY